MRTCLAEQGLLWRPRDSVGALLGPPGAHPSGIHPMQVAGKLALGELDGGHGCMEDPLGTPRF